jgi:4-carboxymuconolactone decarboxylase
MEDVMSRLPQADERNQPELKAVYDRISKTRGYVSNILKGFSNAPEGLGHFAVLGEYVRYRSEIPARTRELSVLAIAAGIEYAWAHHLPHAIKAGVSQAELDELERGGIPATATPAERAAIAYVREYANLGQVRDATFAELRNHFTARQITDLTLLGGYFVALGCAVNAFQIELEPQFRSRQA